MNQQLTVIGLMSGTSLDGIDLCAVQFNFKDGKYSFEILSAETFNYTEDRKRKLKEAYHKELDEVQQFSKEYGAYLGKIVELFILKHNLTGKIDLIGSHGHTIFHEPEKGFTLQIGDGAEITKATGIDTIFDFRSLDVSLGGQGAPLVPIGDKLLFAEFDSCLNLGGIANISFENNDARIAFDICPSNLPLNKIVQEEFGLSFDKNGELAASGTIERQLLVDLNELEYYKRSFPKSLGQEWLDENFYPLFNEYDLKAVDLLRTIVEHETIQIADVLSMYNLENCLITGGGALNKFFIETLKKKSKTEIILPDLEIIEFKEALIFGFLAYLKAHNKVNTLASVTGAKENSIGGVWIKQ